MNELVVEKNEIVSDQREVKQTNDGINKRKKRRKGRKEGEKKKKRREGNSRWTSGATRSGLETLYRVSVALIQDRTSAG
jgi:hypothetical protein